MFESWKSEKRKRMIKSIIIGIIGILILGLSIWFSFYCWKYGRKIWLNEYNAQIEKFGYYKEDIHLLDQQIEKLKWIGMWILDVFGYMVFAGIGIYEIAIYY